MRFSLVLKHFFFAVLIAFGLSLGVVSIQGLAPIGVTPLMVVRAGEAVFDGHLPKFSKRWVPLEEISPRLQQAVIAAEDARFFEHHGFDWEAIQKAAKQNRLHKNRLRGGSTISQQTAKNVYLWPRRSWIRKGLETYLTSLIELTWTKRRILEAYLNVVEFGDGVYGAEAASQTYFHKPARDLNASEAALLAAVLPNPHLFKVSKPSTYVRFRQTMIRRRMHAVTVAQF